MKTQNSKTATTITAETGGEKPTAAKLSFDDIQARSARAFRRSLFVPGFPETNTAAIRTCFGMDTDDERSGRERGQTYAAAGVHQLRRLHCHLQREAVGLTAHIPQAPGVPSTRGIPPGDPLRQCATGHKAGTLAALRAGESRC